MSKDEKFRPKFSLPIGVSLKRTDKSAIENRELDQVSQRMKYLENHPEDYKKEIDRVKFLAEANLRVKLASNSDKPKTVKKVRFNENAEVKYFREYEKDPLVNEDSSDLKSIKEAKIKVEKEKIEEYIEMQKRHTLDDLALISSHIKELSKNLSKDDLSLTDSRHNYKFQEADPRLISIFPSKEEPLVDDVRKQSETASISVTAQTRKLLTKKFMNSPEGHKFLEEVRSKIEANPTSEPVKSNSVRKEKISSRVL